MATTNFKRLFNDFAMTATTVNELRKLATFNMFNTDTLMWFDVETYDLHYDAIRPEFNGYEVKK